MKRFIKILKRTLLVLLILAIILTLTTCFYMQQPQFGKLPRGERLERIKQSPQYKDGKFHNRTERPTISKGYSMFGEAWKMLFNTYPRRSPEDSIPSIRTDLKNLPADTNLLIWMGHSSVLLQLDGKKILLDPVFSGNASPLPWGVKAFKGSNNYAAADFPELDYILISHDHYDHLDYKTMKAFQPKVKKVVCGLGVGAHLEHWGYTAEQIVELDWNDQATVAANFIITALPTHHDGGRGFKRSRSLWMSYMIQSPSINIYYSGDGGYDDRFKEIGNRFPVDIAIMENGQYDKAWESVHNLPEQVAQATVDLKAKRMLSVHHSKFTLAKHPWDEPLIKAQEFSVGKPYHFLTPMIGEVVNINDTTQSFTHWWVGVK